MMPSLKTMFPAIVTMLVFIFAVGMQAINGSSNTSTGISVPNTTGYENGNEDTNTNTNTNTQTQNCQMPPCPPGEMCIQVCPESEP
jgi:hypothetical protein